MALMELDTGGSDYWSMLRPDDWHLHLRDGDNMRSVVADSARRFNRVLVMPNLAPPVFTVEQALAYRQRILDAVAKDDFNPYMTLYLSPEHTTVEEIYRAASCEHVLGVKYYPAGVTTGSSYGVADLDSAWPVLEAMQEVDLPLQVHGESPDPEVDVYDAEKVFLQQVMTPVLDRLPRLRVVLEHISTSDSVEFVRAGHGSGARLAATITVHHIMCNRNDLFAGGLNPHLFCRPVLKRERHREAVLAAALSGEPCFFFGSDSAPHDRDSKETACGCAGVYTACAAIELCAEIFSHYQAMTKLEYFCAVAGASFYGLPRTTKKITLQRRPWNIPQTIAYGDGELVPYAAGIKCNWALGD